MNKEDMVLLIEMEDTLDDMDKALEQLAGHGHASGKFIKLDNVFDVIYHNSHAVYSENPEEGAGVFFQDFNEQGNDTGGAGRYFDEWTG